MAVHTGMGRGCSLAVSHCPHHSCIAGSSRQEGNCSQCLMELEGALCAEENREDSGTITVNMVVNEEILACHINHNCL